MENYTSCWCALPVLRGNTDCCKGCANNPWKDKDILKEWQNFNIDEIKNGRMVVERDEDGSIIKITYYN